MLLAVAFTQNALRQNQQHQGRNIHKGMWARAQGHQPLTTSGGEAPYETSFKNIFQQIVILFT